MKKLITLLLCISLMFSLAACAYKRDIPPPDTSKALQATVVEVNEGYLIVEPSKEFPQGLSTDRLKLTVTEFNLTADVNIGDTVDVYYDGVIQETYPAVVTKVSYIKVHRPVGAQSEDNTAQ